MIPELHRRIIAPKGQLNPLIKRIKGSAMEQLIPRRADTPQTGLLELRDMMDIAYLAVTYGREDVQWNQNEGRRSLFRKSVFRITLDISPFVFL